RSGFNKIEEAEFIDTFRALHPEGDNYTWWSNWGNARERNVGWRIDYVMISKVLLPLLKNARIHPEVFGSDHCPVSVEISL
ncbi:exodeoxyribonuclease III, partial [Candidatus Kaiserbacteria bacterium]|nr:exodeoxyribonuclease III [Candidatus Kaiserbacteria bacterium]